MTQADRVHSTPPTNTSAMPPDFLKAIAHLRREAELEIERLLELIDRIDGDVDLEPSLGFPELTRAPLMPSHPGSADDLEDDADEENFLVDDEPSLGWSADGCHGDTTDLEGEHDGREDGHDAEDDRATWSRRWAGLRATKRTVRACSAASTTGSARDGR